MMESSFMIYRQNLTICYNKSSGDVFVWKDQAGYDQTSTTMMYLNPGEKPALSINLTPPWRNHVF